MAGGRLTVGSLRAPLTGPVTGKGLSVGSLRQSGPGPQIKATSTAPAIGAPKKPCCMSGCQGCPSYARFLAQQGRTSV